MLPPMAIMYHTCNYMYMTLMHMYVHMEDMEWEVKVCQEADVTGTQTLIEVKSVYIVPLPL